MGVNVAQVANRLVGIPAVGFVLPASPGAPFAATVAVFAKGRAALPAIMTGSVRCCKALFAPDHRRRSRRRFAARLQRPFPAILRQPMGHRVAGQIQDDAVAAALFRTQSPAYHLQVQRQTHRGPCDDDAGSVGQVKPLGSNQHIDQHLDAAVTEPGNGSIPLRGRRVAEDNRRRDTAIIEYGGQVVGVLCRDGVGDGLPPAAMFPPELQRAGGHNVRAVAVGLLNAAFGVIAQRAVNGAAGDAPLRGRHHYLRRTQIALRLQFRNLRPAKQFAKEMVKPLLFRQPPGRGRHPDHRAGPLFHRPLPAGGGGMMGFIYNQQVITVIATPDLAMTRAPADGLRHQNNRAAGHIRGILPRRPIHIGNSRDAGVGQHLLGLRGQLPAMGEPDRLAPLAGQPVRQQRAGNDRLAAAGGQLQHHADGIVIAQRILHPAEQFLLVRAQRQHTAAL